MLLALALTLPKESKNNKKLVTAISLDIKGAFDHAWWPALLNRLLQIRCPKNIFSIIKNYIKDRTIELNYCDSTSTKTLTRGCVQGSVLGPLIWNIIMDDLLFTTLPDGCHLQAYADDVLLIVTGNTAIEMENRANEILQIITQWGNNNKLKFGPEKTQMLTNTPRAQSANIKMNELRLNYTNSIKLLGLHIDKRFRFIHHAKETVRKALNI
jgi:hypothetical protein